MDLNYSLTKVHQDQSFSASVKETSHRHQSALPWLSCTGRWMETTSLVLWSRPAQPCPVMVLTWLNVRWGRGRESWMRRCSLGWSTASPWGQTTVEANRTGQRVTHCSCYWKVGVFMALYYFMDAKRLVVKHEVITHKVLHASDTLSSSQSHTHFHVPLSHPHHRSCMHVWE